LAKLFAIKLLSVICGSPERSYEPIFTTPHYTTHHHYTTTLAGGNCCFDEANSTPWAKLSERFPAFPIPMACQSTTVELRGECDVSGVCLYLCLYVRVFGVF